MDRIEQPRKPGRLVRWAKRTFLGVAALSALFVGAAIWNAATMSPERQARIAAEVAKEQARRVHVVKVMHVTRDMYGDTWPYLRYDDATIRCDKPHGLPEVTIELAGGVFGLNGTAMGVDGHPDERFLRDTTEYGTPKVIPAGWISQGLELCEA